MFTTLRLTLVVAVSTFVAACATSPSEPESLDQKLAKKDYQVLEEVDRISKYDIDGWVYVDDYNVVFQSGPSEEYLLSFRQRCINLRGAQAIAFSTTAGRVMRFDKVVVRSLPGSPPEQCLIDRIHRVKKTR